MAERLTIKIKDGDDVTCTLAYDSSTSSTVLKQLANDPRAGRGALLDSSGVTILASNVELSANRGPFTFLLLSRGASSSSGQAGAGAGVAAGRKEDARMSAFIKALQAATQCRVSSGMSMLSCGPGVHFPDDIVEGRGTLLVRDFYSALLQHMTTGRAWLLTGVPGTGKSWFVWYAMHALLQQPEPPAIVWQMFRQGQCVLFKGGKALIGDIKEFKEELDLTSTWFFSDGMLPLNVAARTIMVCSPKRSVYKDWMKVPGVRHLTMPLWKWEEMEECWTQLYQDKLPLARVKRNFDLWYGGVPRLTIERPAMEVHDTLDAEAAKDAIRSTNIDQVIAACSGAYDAGPEASHRVIHQDGDRTTFRKSGYRFATSNVASLFLREVSQRGDLARLVQILSASPGSDAGLRGLLFEAYAHATLLKGGCFQFRYLDRPDSAHAAAVPSTLQLVNFKTEFFFTTGSRSRKHTNIDGFHDAVRQLQQPGAQSTAVYLRPSAQGHPAVDGCIFPDCLLQMTVAETRDRVDEELLEAHLNCLPDKQEYFLDYVVPQDVYDSFKTPKLQRKNCTPRVQKTHVRVIKITDIAAPAAVATSPPPASATPSPSAALPSLPLLGATPASAAAAALQRKHTRKHKRKHKGDPNAEEEKGKEKKQEERRGRAARRGREVEAGAAAAEKEKKKEKKRHRSGAG